MQKHRYEIKFNKGSSRGKAFTYRYGNTENIQLKFSRQNATALFEMTVLKKPEDFSRLTLRLFHDIMRKVYLLHAIIYEQSIKMRSICISIDGCDTCFDDKHPFFPFVFSMLDNHPLELGDLRGHSGIIETILSETKSSSEWDEKQCALYAYLLGKSRSFETDRFMNYWTAMNAYLNCMAKEYEKAEKEKQNDPQKELPPAKKMYKIDNACIGAMICLIQPGTVFPKKPDDLPEFQSAYKAIDRELFNAENLSTVDLYTVANNDLRQHIRNKRFVSFFAIADSVNLSLYAFLLLVYPYWLRCNYFHGSKVTPIVASYTDHEIKDLRIVNCFLDKFLSSHISTMFEGPLLSGTQIELIEKFLKSRNK